MITRKNYTEKLKTIDLATAPQAIKDGNEYALKMIEKGFYEKSATVKETIDLYLEKLNEYVGKSNTKTAQPERKNKARQKASVEAKKATKERLAKNKETASSEKKKETIEEKPKNTKPRKKKEQSPKEKGQHAPKETEEPKKLNSINKCYRLAASYLRMDGKPVTHAKALNLLQSVQNYIIEFKPKLDTLRGEVVDYLQHQLYILEQSSRVKQNAVLTINDEDRKRLAIYSNVALAKAVSLIRRYIALADAKNQALAAGKLLKDINEAIENKQLTVKNKRYEFIQTIKTRLENKNYAPTKAMLSGLKGLI